LTEKPLSEKGLMVGKEGRAVKGIASAVRSNDPPGKSREKEKRLAMEEEKYFPAIEEEGKKEGRMIRKRRGLRK